VAPGSTEHHDEAPVIRLIKKTGHGGHHGGAWKVAYADFVTSMLALFIVLWILGQSEDVKKQVAAYFRDPTGHSLVFAGSAPGQQAKVTFRSQAGTDASLINLNDDALRQLEEEAGKLKEMIEEQPNLQALEGQISVEVTPEGVRVEINESEHQPLFQTGSAKLDPKLEQALRVLGAEYGKVPAKMVIEGHTDNVPYVPGSGMTNWELSTQRATEARRLLMEGGLGENQVFMIRGFADRKPRFGDPADPRNRRISMLLLSPEGLRIATGPSLEAQRSGPIPTIFDQTSGQGAGP
jgi:chemotaxis protein MotB